jgi:hypothetical protein
MCNTRVEIQYGNIIFAKEHDTDLNTNVMELKDVTIHHITPSHPTNQYDYCDY